MLFRTFEPYYNDDIELYNETNFCFICYEFLYENEKPFKLNSKIYYLKNCMCEGFIHKKCIETWYNINKSCPICRNPIFKNEKFLIILYFYSFFYLKNVIKIKKILLFLCFLYFNLEIYLLLLNIKYSYSQSEYSNINENYEFDDIIVKNVSYYKISPHLL